MHGSKLTPIHLNLPIFLDEFKDGSTIVRFNAKEIVFSQGDPSDAVFFIEKGKVKLTVLSQRGREAIVGLPGVNEFIGEQCLAGEMFRRMTVTAVEDSMLFRIDRREMMRALRADRQLSQDFISHLLSRNMRLLDSLVDHFFNHSEQRLARLLVSLSHHAKDGKTETIPKINQETLAEMVGTTRGRISFFMTKFREKGFIDYNGDCNGELRVHSSLLDKVLRD